jgi:methionyl-tRNA formyltransferase
MKIVFFGNGSRGLSCLQTLLQQSQKICAVVLHPRTAQEGVSALEASAQSIQLPLLNPENPNSAEVIDRLKQFEADVFILAGYGKLIRPEVFEIPRLMTVNLHGGKLPQYRGSSPMNWALLNGEKEFTISIIKIDTGVDTGDILAEKTFPISIHDTIVDLHKKTNEHFPQLLKDVLQQLKEGKCKPKPQAKDGAAYYPLRFPEDGLLLWDTVTALEAHNQIRALTEPYPCAFTIFGNRKVKLISSELSDFPYHGEPGRIYTKSDRGLLVCASDRCVWVKKAVFAENGQSVFDAVKRYDRFGSIRQMMLKHFSEVIAE